MTTLDELRVLDRKANLHVHELVPSIRDRHEMRVYGAAQRRDDVGQRIVEILILAASEAMPAHDHATSKQIFRRIHRRQRLAFRRRQQSFDQSVTSRVQIDSDAFPIQRIDSSHSSFLKPTGHGSTIGKRLAGSAPALATAALAFDFRTIERQLHKSKVLES